MSELKYHLCTLSDLDTLRDISIDTFTAAFEAQNNPEDFQAYMAGAFSREQLKRELEDPDMHFYFVFRNGELSGYLKLNTGMVQSELKEDQGMEIERIYVVPAAQGTGLGARMLDFICSTARKAGKTYLWLGVWEHNPRAIAFYERAGFVTFGKHPYYIGADRQTDWLMRLELEPDPPN